MIKKYTKKDGTTAYMFQTYLGVDTVTGKQKRTTRRGFKTEREAKLAEGKLLLEVERNGFKEKHKKMKFQEVYDLWLPQYENTIKESSFIAQKRMFNLHILPVFKDLYIDKISIAYCQKQVNHWYKTYVKYPNLIGLTTRIFAYAVTLGIIQDNPMTKVIRPKKRRTIDEDENKVKFYTKEQVTDFLYKIRDEDFQTRLMFHMLFFTGMRKSELLALRWKDIDLNNNTLTINQTIAKGKDSKIIFQTPKTKNSKRTISLDDKTAKLIKQWDLIQKEDFLALGITGINKKSLVFTDNNNVVYGINYINDALIRLIKKYDLPPITPHGLRHTHCSLLFESGANIQEVQERLGHTDIHTTMNIYTHVTEKAKKQTAQKFAQYVNF